MPWCEDCQRYLNPPTLTPAGECPGCRRRLVEVPKAPWHFKLLLGSAALYLGWRLVQGVDWIMGRL